MSNGDRVDPFLSYNFAVEIDGLTLGGFSEVTMGSMTAQASEYREGTDRPTVRKLPGAVKYDNIVLKWGLTDPTLYKWYADAASGKVERKNGSIILNGPDGEPQVRWNFSQGWPTTWKGPELNAKSNEPAIVSLEIAHEGLEQQT